MAKITFKSFNAKRKKRGLKPISKKTFDKKKKSAKLTTRLGK